VENMEWVRCFLFKFQDPYKNQHLENDVMEQFAFCMAIESNQYCCRKDQLNFLIGINLFVKPMEKFEKSCCSEESVRQEGEQGREIKYSFSNPPFLKLQSKSF